MISRYLKLLPVQLRYALMENFIYRADFLMWLLIDIAWIAVQLLFFSILYSRLNLYGGWSYPEMLLLLGWFYLLKSVIWGLLWPNLFQIPRIIHNGELDLWLIKPVSSQLFLSTRHISLNMISSIVMGFTLLFHAANQLSLRFNFLDFTLTIITFISGAVICYSVWFITVTLVFYLGRLENIIHLFPQFFSTAQFPKTVFPIALQAIITFLIPVGIIAYTPTQILLHRLSAWEVILPILLAGTLLYISHRFWHLALRRYTSASS